MAGWPLAREGFGGSGHLESSWHPQCGSLDALGHRLLDEVSLGRPQAGVLMLTAGGFWHLPVSDYEGPASAELCYLAVTRTRDGQTDGTWAVLRAGELLF